MTACADAAGAAAQAAPAEAPVEEQTDFDLKLDSFEAAAKIKVIKEIRGLSDLGLKEAKELVGVLLHIFGERIKINCSRNFNKLSMWQAL